MKHVVCSIDNGYVQHCAALLASLFENNQDCDFSIFILSDYISEENRTHLNSMAMNYHNSIEYIKVDKNVFKDLPYGGKFPNISLATYYRLLMPIVLPNDIDRILYLDCDIIINGNIEDLFNTDIKGFAVAAVEESPHMSKECTCRLAYPREYSYFNAGVLMINLLYLRQMDFTNKAFEFLKTNLNKIVFHDQDVLNALLYDKKKFLPLKWNVMEYFLFRHPSIDKKYTEQIKEIVNAPQIIHYTGIHKPWFEECEHPYKHLYYEYLKLTPWKGYIPQKQYDRMDSRIKYTIKKVGKYVLDYLHLGSYMFVKIESKQ